MTKKSFLSCVLCLCIMLFAVGCDSNGTANNSSGEAELQSIKVGVSSDMVTVMECGEEALAKLGYKIDLTVFDDFVLPNQALKEGSIDCNFFQHEPFMNVYNESNGTHFVMVQPKVVFTPYGIFSNTIDSLDNIPSGATVAISDEASNRNRSLLLLQEAGVITLNDSPIDEYYSASDIKDNPHNLQFTEVDWFSLYGMLSDVDIVLVAATYVLDCGGDPSSAIYMENDETYAMGVSVAPENKDAEWAKAIVEAYRSQETRDAIDAIYKGAYGFCK